MHLQHEKRWTSSLTSILAQCPNDMFIMKLSCFYQIFFQMLKKVSIYPFVFIKSEISLCVLGFQTSGLLCLFQSSNKCHPVPTLTMLEFQDGTNEHQGYLRALYKKRCAYKHQKHSAKCYKLYIWSPIMKGWHFCESLELILN